jgi:hypothetical protein
MTWKVQMKFLLIECDLWSYTQKEKPTENIPKDWDKNDNKAQAKIGLCLEKTQQHLIRKCESAYEMWNTLRDYHQRKSLSTKLRLLRKLMKMKLPEGGKMPDHLNAIGSLIDELEDVGETLSNHLSVALILASLPESYDNLITTLETSKEDDLDLEYIKGKLIDEWQRKNESRADCSDQALKVMTNKMENHRKGVWKVRCYACNQEGHIMRDCPEVLKKFEEDKKERATVARTSSTGYGDFCFNVTGESEKDWCLDSGATSHMTGDLNFFESLNQCDEKLSMADGRKILVKGRGHGSLANESSKVQLKDVLYTPDLKCNLMSVSKIVDAGYEVNFRQDGCEITQGKQNVLRGTRVGNLYHLNLKGDENPNPWYTVKKRNDKKRAGYQKITKKHSRGYNQYKSI